MVTVSTSLSVRKERAAWPAEGAASAGHGAQDAEEGAGAGTAVILQARGGQNRS